MTKSTKKVITYITQAIIILHLGACKKESNNIESDQSIPKGHVAIKFITSINNNDFAIDPYLETSVPSNPDEPNQNFGKSTNHNTTTSSSIYKNEEGIEAKITVSESKSTPDKSISLLATDNKAISRPMTNGVKYTVYIYDMNDAFIKKQDLTAGGTTSTNDNSIILPGGSAYKYKAISYNSTTSLPVNTGTNLNPTVESGNNDFIYASGTINELPFTTSDNTSPVTPAVNIGIIFNHMTARLDFSYDFSGLMLNNSGTGNAAGIDFTISSSQNSDVNPFSTGQFVIFP